MSSVAALRVAASLLTRVPTGRRDVAPGDLARAVPWLPVVGGGIGVTTGAVYVAALELFAPLLAAALAVGAGIVLTGALHEDGLADTADAAGGRTVEDRRRILDDPRTGAFGVLAITVSVLVRVGALSALTGWDAVGALVAAHALGRGACVYLLARLEPLPGDGLGATWAKGVDRRAAIAGVGLAGVLAVAGLGVRAPAAILLVAVTTAAVRRSARRALGGTNGDVLGAAEQLAEVAVLLVAAAGNT